MWESLLGDIYNIHHPFCQRHWQNSWSPVSKSPLGWCAWRKCVRSECRSSLSCKGCCAVTHYSLILSSLTWLTRYRVCDAPVTNHNLPLTTTMFVCSRCFRCFLILCFYVHSPASYYILFLYKRLVIDRLHFTGSYITPRQPIYECVHVILQYGYFVCVVMYTYSGCTVCGTCEA